MQIIRNPPKWKTICLCIKIEKYYTLTLRRHFFLLNQINLYVVHASNTEIIDLSII